MKTIENKLASVCDTQEYARSLAKKYGKKPLLILLSGNLGAGKTTFAQAFLRQLLNNNISIPSPTYSYMNSYMGNFSIYHFDLYRIEEPNEIYD